MRPNKALNLIDKAIDYRIRTGSNERFTPILLREMNRIWPKWAKSEGDFRNGYETYGYEDAETVNTHLLYISDRFRCAFRLKWLIDGVERGAI